MLIIRQHRIYREDLRNNPTVLYIFGDNLARVGHGGQAKEMRGEPNAFGIATKRRPTHGYKEDYFHDDDWDVEDVINEEFKCLRKHIAFAHKDYVAIVIPSDGIGTGLAKLNVYAPKLLEYINKRLKELETLWIPR